MIGQTKSAEVVTIVSKDTLNKRKKTSIENLNDYVSQSKKISKTQPEWALKYSFLEKNYVHRQDLT